MLGPVPRASSEPRSEIPLVPGGMYALCIQYYQEGARFSAAPIAERPSLLDASEQDPVPETASRYATPRDPHRPRAADESNTRPRGVPAPRPGRAHRPLAEEGRFRQGHPAAADKGDLRNPAPHRALRYGPRLWPDPPDRLERIASALRHLTRAGDAAPDEFHGAGDELHALILRAAGNQAMEQCISQFRTEIDRACYFAMQQPGIAQRLCRQHLAIAERLLAGDATGAAAAMAEHIETVRDSVLGSDATRTAPLPVPEGSDPRV